MFVSLAEEASFHFLEAVQGIVGGFQDPVLNGELSEWRELLCVCSVRG